jgi:hypothetical protein
VIDRIQEHLEAIYGIRCELRVHENLVDGEAARALGAATRAKEELLVIEDPATDSMEVALYLEPELVERVSGLTRMPASEGDGLGEFCQVAEGVSHFVYMAHCASLDRKVSLLELEAQAEVDKFAICTFLRWGEGVAEWAKHLTARLFQPSGYHPHLTQAERWRYEEANRLAKTYAERLLPLIRAGHLDRLLSELRHAYRLGAEATLAYFARSAA